MMMMLMGASRIDLDAYVSAGMSQESKQERTERKAQRMLAVEWRPCRQKGRADG